MKKTLLLTLALMVLPSLASAAPNFSGSWVRDREKSDADPYPLYWLSRPAPGGGGGFGGNQQTVIEIRQSADKLEVVNPQLPVRSYVLDGKPHTVHTDTGIQNAVVSVALQPDTLTITTVQSYGGMPGNVSTKTDETWSLSPDGKTLTVSILRDSPARQQTLKQVYTRQ